jgi:dihydropteroate synthase
LIYCRAFFLNLQQIMPRKFQAIKLHINSVTVLLISENRKLETQTPVIMGVINLTPDSFFSGSRFPSVQKALEQAGQLLAAGAGIIDLGAMSTRPGSYEISADEEMERLLPALTAIRKAYSGAFISVDTYRAMVAEQAISAGADMINDVSGGSFDTEMFDAVAKLNAPYVLMHTGGKPATMQQNPVYGDVIEEVRSFFIDRLNELWIMGAAQVIVDPGFGFGKTIEHNYRLLAGLPAFQGLGQALMVGVSRKSMINKVLNISAAEALNGTTVLNTIALLNGADILRVHDVREAVECCHLVSFYKNRKQT